MKDKINIRQIAKMSGFSIASISRVINGKSGVSEENRRKINEFLKKHNYIADSHLSSAKKIALLCGENNFDDYVGRIFDGVHQYTHHHALNTSIIFSNNNLKMNALEQIRDQQCAGVIVILPLEFEQDFDILAASELPVIIIDNVAYADGIGFIGHDAYSGSQKATEYLLEMGHRNIGYIEFGKKTYNHVQRVKAYEETLNKAGIVIKPEWREVTSLEYSLCEGAYKKMKILMKKAPELTAVMTSNDNLAQGAMKAVWDSGKRVPDDISIIGFDNYSQTEFLYPALTTVNHPIKEMGYLAAQKVDQYLKNPISTELTQIILPTELVIRDSVISAPVR